MLVKLLKPDKQAGGHVTGELCRKSMEDADWKGEEWGEQNGRHFQMHFH